MNRIDDLGNYFSYEKDAFNFGKIFPSPRNDGPFSIMYANPDFAERHQETYIMKGIIITIKSNGRITINNSIEMVLITYM